MKDRHAQTGRADEKNLGDEIIVLQIFGGVGNEEQAARGNGKRAPGQRQNSAGDAAHRPMNGGEPEQSQIDHKNGANH